MGTNVLLMKGIKEGRKGNLTRSIELLRMAVKKDPSSARAHVELGNNYMKLNKLKKAELEYKQALLINPKNMEARYWLGVTYMTQNKESQAINEWYKNIELKPTHIPTLLSLANFYLSKNYLKKAKDIYSKILSIDQNHWEAQIKMGSILYRTGNKKEAKSIWKSVYKREKDNIEAQYMLAETYVQIFDTKEALRVFRNLLRYEQDEESKNDLKDMILAFSNFVTEKRLILSIMKYLYKRFPNSQEVISAYINTLVESEKFQEAEKIVENLLSINSPVGLFYKGLIYKKLGETRKAIEMMEEAYNKGYRSTEILSELGIAWFEDRNFVKAIKFLEDVTNEDSFDQRILWYIALSYQQIGNLEEAIERWMDVISIDPEDTFAYGNMAICYLYMEEIETAIDIIHRAEKIYANDSLILFLRGILYLLDGEPTLTLRKWRKSWNEDPNIIDSYWPIVKDLVPDALLGILKASISKSKYTKAFKNKILSIFSAE